MRKKSPLITRDKLLSFLEEILESKSFTDYCPNGLQIEGKSEIKRIAVAVSASREVILKAIALKADALIVHHGLFWKGNSPVPLVGPFAKRVFPIIQNEMNLFAYHLPLDAHLKLGNAALIAKHLKLKQIKAFGEMNKKPLGVKGNLKPTSVLKLKETLEIMLKHPVLLSTPNKKANIKSIGIITGGASHYWKDCLKENPPLDAYITGEMAEQDYFEAAEAGIHMFACGHHASETFGVKALLDLISTKFKLEGHFISTDNPA